MLIKVEAIENKIINAINYVTSWQEEKQQRRYYSMNKAFKMILPVFVAAFGWNPVFGQTAKEIHTEIHQRLLANAKSSIDKTAIQEYIKKELEVREESPYPDLSHESVAMLSDLLEEARSHSGKRYRYGAKGPNNFDCSGFTGYVYGLFGFELGSSSSGQYSQGVAVEKDNLRPGDLVFFSSPRSKGGVGHVGIVVNVDNEKHTFSFIHSAVSAGIQIDRSTAPYYAKRYIGARRIITE